MVLTVLQKRLFEIIKRGQYEFDSPDWDPISAEAKDLIRHILVRHYTPYRLPNNHSCRTTASDTNTWMSTHIYSLSALTCLRLYPPSCVSPICLVCVVCCARAPQVVDPMQRYTAEQILAHPWVTGEAAIGDVDLTNTRDQLKRFNARRKLKVSLGVDEHWSVCEHMNPCVGMCTSILICVLGCDTLHDVCLTSLASCRFRRRV